MVQIPHDILLLCHRLLLLFLLFLLLQLVLWSMQAQGTGGLRIRRHTGNPNYSISLFICSLFYDPSWSHTWHVKFISSSHRSSWLIIKPAPCHFYIVNLSYFHMVQFEMSLIIVYIPQGNNGGARKNFKPFQTRQQVNTLFNYSHRHHHHHLPHIIYSLKVSNITCLLG